MLLEACSIKLYVPNETNVTDYVTLIELKSGRDLYLNKCSNCHDLHLPHEFTHDEWVVEVNKMQPKAKITDSEKELILRYLWNAQPNKKRRQQ